MVKCSENSTNRTIIIASEKLFFFLIIPAINDTLRASEEILSIFKKSNEVDTIIMCILTVNKIYFNIRIIYYCSIIYSNYL